MTNKETHTCPTCKYTWVQGQNGKHTCSKYLLEEIEELKDNELKIGHNIQNLIRAQEETESKLRNDLIAAKKEIQTLQRDYDELMAVYEELMPIKEDLVPCPRCGYVNGSVGHECKL